MAGRHSVDAKRVALNEGRYFDDERNQDQTDDRVADGTPRWRPDIQGLRAVAVVLVLLWHSGISLLPGGFIGVDVFFVVSGYLMTQILLREANETGRIRVLGFYARRFRRLIPASTLVLAVTALATYLVLPSTRWFDTGLDTVAAGMYVVNWTLAAQSVDYLAQDYAPSPIQHFWSLSVEEQYYVFWPLLVLVVVVLALRLRISFKRTLAWVVGLIFVVSLVWSIKFTNADPGPAYFVTTTRVWELALGAAVAITAAVWVRLNPSVATMGGWLGLAMIIATAALLRPSVPFPGSVALIPTLGTALVLACGSASHRRGPEVILRGRTVQWVGGVSYSLYLWHWPFLVVGGYLITSGGLRDINAVEGIALVGLSVVPAWASTRWLEKPFHRSPKFTKSTRNSFGVGLGGIAIAVVAGLALVGAGHMSEKPLADSQFNSRSSDVTFGAQVLSGGSNGGKSSYGSISPDPTSARKDNPPVYGNGCHQPASSSEAVACEFGDVNGTTTVALVGDSHAAHWVDGLDYVAKQRGWRLLSYTKSACPLMSATVINRGVPARKCSQWNSNVLSELQSERPAAVFVSNIDYRLEGASDDPSAMVSALGRSWKRLDEMGSKVFVLRDTPASKFDPPDCIAGHETEPERCATDRKDAFAERGQTQAEAVKANPFATLIDLNPWICPSDPCQPVIGGVLVYRDRTHMTATYSRSLGPRLESLIPRLTVQ